MLSLKVSFDILFNSCDTRKPS